MLIGHEHILAAMKALVKRGILPHGHLFFGAEGAGKKTLALAFAGWLEGKEEDSASPLQDAMCIGPGNENSIGIDAVRTIRHFLLQKPYGSAYKTVIVDDAHYLTAEAQDALLKVVEEPPGAGLLIMTIPDVELISKTLRSRLRELYFPPVPKPEIIKWLEAKGYAKGAAAAKIAAGCFGRPGLACRLATDETFREALKKIRELVKAPASEQKALLKEIIAPENFRLDRFLDSFALVLLWRGAGKHIAMPWWHTFVEIRSRSQGGSLNSRIQIEYLLSLISQ